MRFLILSLKCTEIAKTVSKESNRFNSTVKIIAYATAYKDTAPVPFVASGFLVRIFNMMDNECK